MSSPFEPGTKKGMEETIQAIKRTTVWAGRIDTKNDLSKADVDVDIGSFISELNDAEDELRERYRIKTTEVSIDNFVFNQEDKVEDILCGDLDTRVAVLSDLDDYIADDFGYIRPLSLSKEEMLWLVAQEVQYHQEGTSHGVDAYNEAPFTDLDLSSVGQRPELWAEEYPIYNRDL